MNFKHLKAIRERDGLSLRELSRRSGVSHSYLSQLETGKNNNPTNETVRKLAKGLNLTYLGLYEEVIKMDRDYEDPRITEYNQKGYLGKEPEVIGYDFFGNEYFEGEDLLKFDDEVFLLENLSSEAREILVYWGASRVEARK